MTPAELRKWLGQYDATPPEDARRRQAIREGLVLHTPDIVRDLLDLRDALAALARRSEDAATRNNYPEARRLAEMAKELHEEMARCESEHSS